MTRIQLGQFSISPGTRQRVEIPVAHLPTQTPISIPVEVVNGARPGPRLWLSAALHGDEINGVEIVHRILERVQAGRLRGQLIAAPIVNVFGFINRSRYLPDGRDLNRHFPGSRRGSLASRLADLFLKNVAKQCTHGIDLHSASGHRINLPQIRADLDNAEARRIAEAFGAPIMIDGRPPAGSLRSAAAKLGIPVLLYEAGEHHRFNRDAVDLGIKGILRVMSELGMIRRRGGRRRQSMETKEKAWIRARRSGILRLSVKLGQWVVADEVLGVIHDAFGDARGEVRAPAEGLIIGHTNHPMVNQGDAIILLAQEVNTRPW